MSINEYRKGWFEVQDANSQKISPWLEAEPGKYYIDACAGAGGKSLHLANLTKDSAKIVALDIYSGKLNELRKRCHRNNIQSVSTVNVKDKKILQTLEPDTDGILIDAPCSGLGVLKRNPDAKWNISPEQLNEILKTQEKSYKPIPHWSKKGENWFMQLVLFYQKKTNFKLKNSLAASWDPNLNWKKNILIFLI